MMEYDINFVPIWHKVMPEEQIYFVPIWHKVMPEEQIQTLCQSGTKLCQRNRYKLCAILAQSYVGRIEAFQ